MSLNIQLNSDDITQLRWNIPSATSRKIYAKHILANIQMRLKIVQSYELVHPQNGLWI